MSANRLGRDYVDNVHTSNESYVATPMIQIRSCYCQRCRHLDFKSEVREHTL